MLPPAATDVEIYDDDDDDHDDDDDSDDVSDIIITRPTFNQRQTTREL